jgi:nucleotide-binding universal stress UspA family protein
MTLLEGPGSAAETAGATERFVVGIDGSTQSIDALRWASRIAATNGARIDVLMTWKPGLGISGPYVGTAFGNYINPEDESQELLSRAVAIAYGEELPPNVTLLTREGDAADILIAESAFAQLLVVGSRGLGEISGHLLGSVSTPCAERAHCPVLIMHPRDPS